MVVDCSSPEVNPADDRRCPHCDGSLRLLRTLLHTVNGKTVRVFECGACTRLVWDD